MTDKTTAAGQLNNNTTTNIREGTLPDLLEKKKKTQLATTIKAYSLVSLLIHTGCVSFVSDNSMANNATTKGTHTVNWRQLTVYANNQLNYFSAHYSLQLVNVLLR